MIEPNALYEMSEGCGPRPVVDEQEWLPAEQRQQNWLHMEQDEQDYLRAKQETSARPQP